MATSKTVKFQQTETEVAVLQVQVENIEQKVGEIKEDMKDLRKIIDDHAEENQKTLKEMKEAGEWVPKTGKYKDSWQIDHIIPHRQGFELGIEPSVLGSKKNIQFIKGEENRKKWDSYQTVEVVKLIIGGQYGL